MTALAAGAAIYLIYFMMNYNNWFVHPHSSAIQLDALVSEGLNFRWSDWLKPLGQVDTIEDRSRFIAYGVTLIDYRLRFLAYDNFVLFPPFSVSWILIMGICPWLLFRTARNLGMGVSAAVLTAILYLTSTGFLSSLTMVMLAAKPLSNGILIICLYLASRLKLKAREGQLLFEIRSPLKMILLLVILTGLFTDEMPLFAFILLPLVFSELFVPPSAKIRDIGKILKNTLYFMTPFLLFLLLIVFIVPEITQRAFNYRFDYLGTAFATKEAEMATGKSLFANQFEGFGIHSFTENLLSLFGTVFVPGNLSPFITHRSSGAVFSGQSHTAAQALILSMVLILAAAAIFFSEGEKKIYLRRFVVASLLYVLFTSILIGRHVVFMTGYYYGCAFGLFLAFAVGFCFEKLNNHPLSQFLSTVLAGLIVAVQLANFSILNRSHIEFHNEVWTKSDFKNVFPIADKKPLTRDELHQIRLAWKEKRLISYLREHPISSGAAFLLAELRHRDKISRA